MSDEDTKPAAPAIPITESDPGVPGVGPELPPGAGGALLGASAAAGVPANGKTSIGGRLEPERVPPPPAPAPVAVEHETASGWVRAVTDGYEQRPAPAELPQSAELELRGRLAELEVWRADVKTMMAALSLGLVLLAGAGLALVYLARREASS